jgi:DedD protein
MSDQGVREIQLSGKQLVFLFMAAVVFTVVVFLLGVSVGRGVRESTGGAVMASTGTTKATELPPPTKPAPGDLTYDTALQAPKGGESGKPSAATPPPAPPPAPPATETKQAPAPESKSAPQQVAKPVTDTPAPPAPPPPPAGTVYWVQVGLFKDRSNAEKLQRELKTEGFAATIQPVTGGSVRVRVGPYTDKSQADATARKLARHKAMVTTR